MGKRADRRRLIKKMQASEPDRERWILEILETGPHFRMHEDEDFLQR